MTTRIVSDEHDRAALLTWLGGQSLPITVNVTKGKDRSLQQNRLAFTLYREIAEQLGDQTPEEVRAEAKLIFGVPILRAESEQFREVYDRLIKGRPHCEKLELMAEPMDLPITRIMTTKQMTSYLDQIYRNYSQQGLELTVPAH